MSRRFGPFVLAATSCCELKTKGTRPCSRLLKEMKVTVMITGLTGPNFIKKAQLLTFHFLVNAAELKTTQLNVIDVLAENGENSGVLNTSEPIYLGALKLND